VTATAGNGFEFDSGTVNNSGTVKAAGVAINAADVTVNNFTHRLITGTTGGISGTNVDAALAQHGARGSRGANVCLKNASALHSQPSSPANGSAEWPPDDRLRRAIRYSEGSVTGPRSRGVLDTPLSRSMTVIASSDCVRRSSQSEGGRRKRYPSIAFCVMGIAEFIIGRAFARPVGSTHATNCLAPTRWRAMTLANIVARMERSEIRDSRDPGPGLRGACHRAALRADPLAPSGLQPLTTRPAQVICPSGGLLTGLSSLFFRIFRKILVPSDPNHI
jgi:hypothetical protein